MPLVLFGGLVLLALAMLIRPVRQAVWSAARNITQHGGQNGASIGEGVDHQEPSFSGPAFSPDATVEDLRNQTQLAVQRLADMFPDLPRALSIRASWYFALGDRNEAFRLWERCLGIEPDFVDAQEGMARCAFDKGDYETALKWSRNALELDYRNRRVQAVLADALLKLDRLDELIAELEPVLRTGALSAETGVPLGQAFLQQREYENARRAFEAVLAATPGSDRLRKQAHYGLATLYAIEGHPEKAAGHRQRFQELSDVDLAATRERIRTTADLTSIRTLAIQIHSACAHVYEGQGRDELAEEMWCKAAVLGPQDAESRTQLALLYEKAGREEDALRVCEQLVEIEPSNPDYWLNAGLLMARLYRFDEALLAIEKAMQINPRDEKYRHAYEAIQSSR